MLSQGPVVDGVLCLGMTTANVAKRPRLPRGKEKELLRRRDQADNRQTLQARKECNGESSEPVVPVLSPIWYEPVRWSELKSARSSCRDAEQLLFKSKSYGPLSNPIRATTMQGLLLAAKREGRRPPAGLINPFLLQQSTLSLPCRCQKAREGFKT